jgi:hypothetical protein
MQMIFLRCIELRCLCYFVVEEAFLFERFFAVGSALDAGSDDEVLDDKCHERV